MTNTSSIVTAGNINQKQNLIIRNYLDLFKSTNFNAKLNDDFNVREFYICDFFGLVRRKKSLTFLFLFRN